jgi:2-amino-4-hydroxy-6-hydroxymethyldihydropteridine diphosphokinase
MSRAVLSIGSNLGDRLGHLQSVLDDLGVAVRAVSAVYQTAPWGPVQQDDFLNAVLIADDPALDAVGWLRRAQRIELAAGRTRELRWGPRTLDVDLVDVDRSVRTVHTGPELILPHPRAARRAFVLKPWLDVEPDAVLLGKGVRELLAQLPESERHGVRRRDDLWLRPTVQGAR